MTRNGNKRVLQAVDGEYLPAVPGGSKVRRFRLTNARGIRRELAALYGELRNGMIDIETAKAGGFILRTLLEAVRTDDIDRRLMELEENDQ